MTSLPAKLEDVLMITWHGIHELEVFPGLPDTGGQNVYVQNLAEAIHDLYDARVITLNRGGFPHPYTARMRQGLTKDPRREVYILHASDEIPAFVRKEYLTPALIERAVEDAVSQLPDNYRPDLIISHFWDGGMMGEYLNRMFRGVPHVWVPHEPVGMKKDPLPERHHDRHSIAIREHCEGRIAEAASFVGSTSKLVRDDLVASYGNRDGWSSRVIDVFPGVDTLRFHPSKTGVIEEERLEFASEFLRLPEEVFRAPHICEFGRSDVLKHKDLAVRAFAQVARKQDDVVMFTNIDQHMEPGIATKVEEIIREENLRDRVFVLSPEQLPQTGPGSTILPELMRTSRVFLSMSSMEGFGMAACEAAASGVPVVGTRAIPVVTDEIAPAGGGVAVATGDHEAAGQAVLDYLDLDPDSWAEVSRRAYKSVIPKYTWESITKGMFSQIAEAGGPSSLRPRGKGEPGAGDEPRADVAS